MPWLTGWAHRKEIRYGTVFPGSNLTDFPVLLKVTTDSDIAAELSDGNGITVTAADGDTEIPFGLYPGADLSAGTFILRFKASPLTGASTGDVMAYIYYDDAETTVEDKAGVVSNSYVIFMPLEEDPSGSSPQMYDWVSQSNIGVSNGSMTSGDLVAAEVGNGLDLDGTNDYINVPDQANFDQSYLTAEVAVYMPSTWSGYKFQLSRETHWYIAVPNGDDMDFAVWSNSALMSNDVATNVFSTSTWYALAVTHDGTTGRAYIDGVQSFTSALASGTVKTGTAPIQIGAYGGADTHAGRLDEVRVSSVARSADWLAYAYENDFNNSSTVTLGAEEDEPSGGTTVTPTTLALVLTTYAPTVSTPVLCTPTTAALTLTTFAPTASTPVVCTPATLAIVTTGYEPSVNIGYTITPDTLALTLTTYAPTVSTPVTCTPTTAALTITTYAPVIDDGSGPYSSVVSIVTRF